MLNAQMTYQFKDVASSQEKQWQISEQGRMIDEWKFTWIESRTWLNPRLYKELRLVIYMALDITDMIISTSSSLEHSFSHPTRLCVGSKDRFLDDMDMCCVCLLRYCWRHLPLQQHWDVHPPLWSRDNRMGLSHSVIGKQSIVAPI